MTKIILKQKTTDLIENSIICFESNTVQLRILKNFSNPENDKYSVELSYGENGKSVFLLNKNQMTELYNRFDKSIKEGYLDTRDL